MESDGPILIHQHVHVNFSSRLSGCPSSIIKLSLCVHIRFVIDYNLTMKSAPLCRAISPSLSGTLHSPGPVFNKNVRRFTTHTCNAVRKIYNKYNYTGVFGLIYDGVESRWRCIKLLCKSYLLAYTCFIMGNTNQTTGVAGLRGNSIYLSICPLQTSYCSPSTGR